MNMTTKEAKQALEAIDNILHTEGDGDWEDILYDEKKGYPVKARESAMAHTLHEIYDTVHPLFCKACKDRDK